MSLSSAISNSLSGLTAAARGTEVVSTNIASKSVAGFARRELELSSRIYAANGGGVSIDGISRLINSGLLSESRQSQATAARSGILTEFHAAMETSFGTANDSTSLMSVLTAFDTSLISASARPDSEVRLREVFDSAVALSDKVNSIAQSIEDARTQADKSISTDVGRLNDTLGRIAELNRQITTLKSQGHDASSLIDARQAAIDDISDIVPVVEVGRENGRIALFTKGGATLLDGSEPARIEFSASGHVTADMDVSNGSLSLITLNGKPLSESEMAILSGGSLAANFEIRDKTAPAYQTQVDALARELYDRFSGPQVDPSLSVGQHGLFSDHDNDLAAGNEPGLANRISVSTEFNPDSGGALWRIRAGMNAPDAGDSGNSSLLLAMSSALSENRSPASPSLSNASRSMLTLATEQASQAASFRIRSESTNLQNETQLNSLKTALLSGGVDTDTEMQSLLMLENAYAANAKVLQTANDMLDELLRLL